jgi:hypothetical protein
VGLRGVVTGPNTLPWRSGIMALRPTLATWSAFSGRPHVAQDTAWFMAWLLCVGGNIFKILYTKFIFREIIPASEQLHADSRLK